MIYLNVGEALYHLTSGIMSECDRSYIHINVELFLFLRAAVLFLRLEALKGKYHFKGKKHIKIFYMCCLNACYVQLITFFLFVFLVFFPNKLDRFSKCTH